jgi:hypothetical protein
MTQEALKQIYQLLLTEPHAPTVCARLERIAREALAEHAMSRVQRLGQEIEQEPVAHCEAGPNYCWKCLEESNPTHGSEEIKKLREVNKSLMKNIEELKKEPPPFWPVVQHLLDEYGLQFIDIVAAYRESTQPEQEPHGWYIDGYGAVIGTAEPKSVRVGEWLPWYTTPPQRTWVGLTDDLYNELLFAVGNKCPNETRHQTALRYILQAEKGDEKAAHGIKENT